MEIRTGALSFEHSRGSGPRTAETTFVFPRAVTAAVAGLVGQSVGFFRPDGDHEVGLLHVELRTQITGNAVTITGVYGLRDWSGEWDDEYEGILDIVVVAELQDASLPPPRGDLIVSGMEINQATQAFRSHLHLDAANVLPNNSIPLVARKPTGVRVYVDYDASSGLPIINTLSGELQVLSGGTTLTLSPLAAITPLRDAQIDRSNDGHTLTFIIPEALCQGDLTLRCRVFDAANTASGSPLFQESARFREVEELRLVAVLINYTGQGMNATPTMAAMLNSLSFTEDVYPIPEVFVTSALDTTFSEDFSPTGSGCGDAFGNLLDELEDFVGDADELVFGFLPAGITFGPAVGCGRSGVGAGPVDRNTTVAHELGHALGRKHAPAGCGNPDENFPQYGSFASGSIGEFGFDTRNGVVRDPASFFDLMCGRPRWISPYTYRAVGDQFPPVDLSDSADTFTGFRLAASDYRMSRGGVKRAVPQRLFLGVSIERDRTVSVRPSFHYQAPPPKANGERTDFTVECLDEEGRTLLCSPLYDVCVQCDGECWPKTLRARPPFPEPTRFISISEGKERLLKLELPPAPSIDARWRSDPERKLVRVEWQVKDDEEDCWFLVQWRDPLGVWRGLGPRTQERFMDLPYRLFGRRESIPVRVLGTRLITTSVCEISVERPREAPPPTVELLADDLAVVRRRRAISVKAVRSDGMTVRDPDVLWFDQNGAQIGRGKELSLKGRGGQQLIRAVLRDTGFGQAERTWLLELDTQVKPRSEDSTDEWWSKARLRGGR